MEVLYAELNERVEAATGSYSVTGDSLQYIYSVPVTKNHRNIRSRCLVHEFSFTYFFNDINHVYRAAILKKYSLWLLSFYMFVATYFYYEKACRTIRTAIASNLIKRTFWKWKQEKTSKYVYCTRTFFKNLKNIQRKTVIEIKLNSLKMIYKHTQGKNKYDW